MITIQKLFLNDLSTLLPIRGTPNISIQAGSIIQGNRFD